MTRIIIKIYINVVGNKKHMAPRSITRDNNALITFTFIALIERSYIKPASNNN